MNEESNNTKRVREPSIFDNAEFEKKLIEHVRKSGGVTQIGGQGFVQGLVKRMFQALLEVEMEEHLGYSKYGAQGTDNSRNGKTSKKVRGDFGEVEIETPRDRNGSFEPLLIRKRQTSVGNFSDKIVSLYSRGITTREIEEHLRDCYGIEVSAQFISNCTQRVEQEIKEWQNRPIEKVYPLVYVDGLRVSVHTGNNSGAVIKKCIYTVLGVDITGKQEVLGLWIEETEAARFWLKVFNELKARGLQDILIVCGDGLTGLDKALEAVYPQADLQLCVVHHIRNATKFVSYKDRKSLCADMRHIYTAPTTEAAKLALEAFDQKWSGRYPASVDAWKNKFDALTTFLKYPVELRKIIYTTNKIESLHAQMRKNIQNRKVFPNDEAVLKLLFLNVRNFSARWNARQGWDLVLNQLLIMFPERLAHVVQDQL